MKTVDKFLKDNPIINRAALAKAIGMSRQSFNNKLKANNKCSLSEEEKLKVKEQLTIVLSKVFTL